MNRRVPNPKYSERDVPVLPLCGLNSTQYFLGRQYQRGKNGTERCYIYIEKSGTRRYMSEKWLDDMLDNAYNSLPPK
jgi:hypothetical protein